MTIYAIHSLECNDCYTNYPAQPDQLGSELVLVRAALADGWTCGAGAKRRSYHRCPGCTAKAQELGWRTARATCSVCGTERSLNVDGTIRHHRVPASPGHRRWNDLCNGSHRPPKATASVQVAADGQVDRCGMNGCTLPNTHYGYCEVSALIPCPHGDCDFTCDSLAEMDDHVRTAHPSGGAA